jgi:sigma-B regulation protein RsbU (phosphoserine phosphatase)
MLSTRGLSKGEYQVVAVNMGESGGDEDPDPWSHGVLAVHRGGAVAEMIRGNEPGLYQGVDWTGDTALKDELAGYDSAMAIPLAGEHLPMSWIIMLRRHPARFTAEELEQAVLRIVVISSLLESQSLAREVAEAHELIDREVKRVGQIQRELLPAPLPEIAGLEIAASYETFGQAGGDLYDFIELGKGEAGAGRWVIFMGDASGHGPSAAVVIAIVQALLHSHPPGVTGPGGLLGHINNHLCSRPIESSFVTAFLGVYDAPARRLVYASAGHPAPLVVRGAERTIATLECACGYPLGIDANQSFCESSVVLNRGEALLMYTVGIEEARDPNDAMFEIAGIKRALGDCSSSPAEMVACVRRRVAAHVGGRPVKDDQTLLAIAVK